jgi:hypothetical protein
MEPKSKPLPPVPPKKRSPKGAGSEPEEESPKIKQPDNIDEGADRANVRQNTSNR